MAGANRAYRAEEALGDQARATRVDDAHDRKQQHTSAYLKHRSRELSDRLLLLADDPLTLEDQDIDDEPNVEERNLLERHEVLEALHGRPLILLHDGVADVLQQLVERAQEETRIETCPSNALDSEARNSNVTGVAAAAPDGLQ
jgi:hypothetical protein